MKPFVLAAVAVAALACGPSFQAIYEGDAQFEHCYAIDDAPNAPMMRKAECWSDWTKHYTYGQTRDRVEYATMRYRALSRVPSLPTDEAMMGAAPGEGRNSNITTPAPTNAFAPPPKTIGETDGGAAPSAPPTSVAASVPPGTVEDGHTVVSPPRTSCVDGCGNVWQDCKSGCTAKGCDKCDKTYGKCVKACF